MPTAPPAQGELMPSILRDAAMAALAAKEKAEADAEAAAKAEEARTALARIAKTSLKKWFPNVKWEYVGALSDGTTLVREKDGDGTVLGATPIPAVEGGAPADDTSSAPGMNLAVFTPLFGLEGQWKREWELGDPADLGAYFKATEPQPAPEPLDVQA